MQRKSPLGRAMLHHNVVAEPFLWLLKFFVPLVYPSLLERFCAMGIVPECNFATRKGRSMTPFD